MPAATDKTRPRFVVAEQPILDLHAASIGAAHLRTKNPIERAHRMLVQIGDPPIEPGPRHAEGIFLGAEGNARIWIGCLLLTRRQMIEALRSGAARGERSSLLRQRRRSFLAARLPLALLLKG